ncbi:YceI family protein [Echinicola marina]|uniref:YceI family protein n=1 Tax=Echinicola marina TaxID=2859768 RepID=UPI001CF6A9FA|nr:YceI family protein [Echinicola marina]UCS93007.1 YceI family protein [Echinicola marina]
MKANLIVMMLCLIASPIYGQAFRTESSEVSFFSSAPLEDIKAKNEEVIGVFNGENGAIAFVVQIKGFRFAKSLMQEHFNENFMESEKYPRATFEGKVMDYDLGKSGEQEVRVKGTMSIHGESQEMEEVGTFEKKGEAIMMKAVFPIVLVDYNIAIPKILFQKIAEEVEVTVYFKFVEG